MDSSGFGIAGDEASETVQDSAWQRSAVRESMLLMATLSLETQPGIAIPLRVRNLSAGGLMAECERQPVQGERVRVDLRNVGEVAGSIAWAGGGRLGVRFDCQIDPKAARKPVTAQAVAPRLLVSPSGRRPGLR